jgi:GMP synthase (glutamine-hydrolysing)
MAWNLKGQVAQCDHREYGFAKVKVARFGSNSVDALFENLGTELEASIMSLSCLQALSVPY